MKTSWLLISVLAFSLLLAPAGFAQSIDEEPPALDVLPAGSATQEWQVVRAVVRTVASPAGRALPGYVDGGFGPGGVWASLSLDGKFELFSYNCGSERCTGVATEVWRALGRDQQQAYGDAIADALAETFPDKPQYIVAIEGIDTHGRVGLRIVQDHQGLRRYRFAGL